MEVWFKSYIIINFIVEAWNLILKHKNIVADKFETEELRREARILYQQELDSIKILNNRLKIKTLYFEPSDKYVFKRSKDYY